MNKKCKNCGAEITKKSNVFCSSSCSATYNNKRRKKKTINCLSCDELTSNAKYCNNKCQRNHQRQIIFEKIEKGDTSLTPYLYKNFLIQKYGEKCMECGWSKRNPTSGKIPIELEHIDGDSTNNSLENLKLLCPNCHSLTPTYKALNTGNGRHSRRSRYKEGKSY